MTVRYRQRAIRLIALKEKFPEYFEKLNVDIKMTVKKQIHKEDDKLCAVM